MRIATFANQKPTMQYEAIWTETVEDVLNGYRMSNHQGDDFLKVCAFGGITALLIFGIAAYVLHFTMLAIIGMVIVGGVVGGPWLKEWKVRRFAKTSERAEVTFRFTENGFEYSDRITQSKEPWDEITKASLDARGMLLHFGRRSYCVFIPARSFVGGYFPLEELKSLLLSKKIKVA